MCNIISNSPNTSKNKIVKLGTNGESDEVLKFVSQYKAVHLGDDLLKSKLLCQ